VRREQELELLNQSCVDAKSNMLLLHAPGGTGKTAVLKHWLNQLQDNNWNGFELVFGWSFYSQGTDEARQASSEKFIHEILVFFQDPNPDAGSASDKVARLVSYVQKQKTLLVLDGLEPLQQSAPPPGKIRDSALSQLINDLAVQNPGLLVITSRLPIPELKTWKTVNQHLIEFFQPEEGAALLAKLGVLGSIAELQQTAKDFGGHGLALVLLATWLNRLHGGDVRHCKEIALLDATDIEYSAAHAQRVMVSYEKFFGKNSAEIAFLMLLSLFDRPATQKELSVLYQAPVIKGLTDNLGHVEKHGGFLGFWQSESFVPIDNEHWQAMLENLTQARLLAKNSDLALENKNQPQAAIFDTHPLVREHFARVFQKLHPQAWSEAHRRLYEYFKTTSKELPETFEEMQPLYAAVAHACRAGLFIEARYDVWKPRIQRDEQFFSINKLGLMGSELSLLANYFEKPWTKPVKKLDENLDLKAFILNHVAVCLRAQGRLREALEPMRAAEDMLVTQENWIEAAKSAGNLSELQVTLGDLSAAVATAERSVKWADESGDAFERLKQRSKLADAQQLQGESEAALDLFAQAELMQKERQSEYPLLYSVQGYRYCDCLLAGVTDNTPSMDVIREVRERAEKTIKIAEQNNWILDIALDHLTIARSLSLSVLSGETVDRATIDKHFQQAVQGLRDAGTQDHLPHGLLHRATWQQQQGSYSKAKKDLSEALQIAKRGEMLLHEADAHLGLASLLNIADYEKIEGLTAQQHLKQAEKIINQTKYESRRKRILDLQKQLLI
jgi:tetratricopeptide (TPR) repeat protein